MLTKTHEGVLSKSENQGAYMPSVLELDDGEWIGVQHTGTHLAGVSNDLEVLISHDEGDNWSLLSEVITRGADDKWSYNAPVLTQLQDNSILMTLARYAITEEGNMYDPETGGICDSQLLFFRSYDLGRSWSEANIIDFHLMHEGHVCSHGDGIFEVEPGHWILNFETWRHTSHKGPYERITGVAHSFDEGKTWPKTVAMAKGKEDADILFGDSKITRLSDGRLAVTFWAHTSGSPHGANNHIAFSDDDGHTWSPLQETNIRGQLCAPIALPDGRLAAIYNYRREVHQIRVAVSEDHLNFDLENECVVFNAAEDERYVRAAKDEFIDKHQQVAFGWPHGKTLRNGSILTYFWCTRDNITHTRWVRLN